MKGLLDTMKKLERVQVGSDACRTPRHHMHFEPSFLELNDIL